MESMNFNTATLIFVDVPAGTEFGIDLKFWTIGERFKGIKDIPPGFHYIYYGAPRMGFTHFFKKGELLVRKWCPETEIITDELTEGEIAGIKLNFHLFDSSLGPFPHDILEKWTALSHNINQNLIDKLNPECGIIRSVLELESVKDADRPRGHTVPSTSLPNLKPLQKSVLRLTDLPSRCFPEGASPEQITRSYMDKIYEITTFIKNYDNILDVIGELEFCFICFLIGHSLEAFDQWKKIVTLLCSSEQAIKTYTKLYNTFLPVVKLHVEEIPAEFLFDIISNNNVIYTNLKNFFRNVLNCNCSDYLTNNVEKFADELRKTYGWDFSHLNSDEEDELPVIVETND